MNPIDLDALERDIAQDGTGQAWTMRHLIAELRAARQDAARYRWLRDHEPRSNRVPHVTQYPYVAAIDSHEYPYFVKVGLDAAIDAAIAKGTP